MPGLKAKFKATQKVGFIPVIIYGDCVTGDQIDAFLYGRTFTRLPGPHFYHSLTGEAEFEAAMKQALRTFFLTDCMVCHFERIVMRGFGLHDHRYLRDTDFALYKRVLYIGQTDDAALVEKALQAAATLQLDYEHYYPGYYGYTAFLYDSCRRNQPSAAVGLTHC